MRQKSYARAGVQSTRGHHPHGGPYRPPSALVGEHQLGDQEQIRTRDGAMTTMELTRNGMLISTSPSAPLPGRPPGRNQPPRMETAT